MPEIMGLNIKEEMMEIKEICIIYIISQKNNCLVRYLRKWLSTKFDNFLWRQQFASERKYKTRFITQS